MNETIRINIDVLILCALLAKALAMSSAELVSLSVVVSTVFRACLTSLVFINTGLADDFLVTTMQTVDFNLPRVSTMGAKAVGL